MDKEWTPADFAQSDQLRDFARAVQGVEARLRARFNTHEYCCEGLADGVAPEVEALADLRRLLISASRRVNPALVAR